MQRYALYVMRLLLWPALMITLTLTGIIWLTQALRFIDFIINRGLSVFEFVRVTGLLLPSLLVIVVPVALFVSTLFAYQRLAQDSELTVLEASGLSPMKVAFPAIVMALIFTVFVYINTLWLQPAANREFKDLQTFLRSNYSSVMLQEEVFNTPMAGLTVYVRERSNDGLLKGILVHDNRVKDHAVTMMAEEGQIVNTPSGPSFNLMRGMRQEEQDGRISWLDFDRYNVDLNFYAEASKTRPREAKERYLSELFSPEAEASAEENRFRSEAHQRLTWPMFTLALALLAVITVISGEFSRRGIWKRIAMSSAIALGLVLCDFGLINMLVKLPMAWPFAYIFPLALIGCLFWRLQHDAVRTPQKVNAA
ncbi:MAG: LptF/LptG family permease [Rickettsiales bacterium]